MKTVDALIAGKKLIVKYGRIKGKLGSPVTGFCPLGAVAYAINPLAKVDQYGPTGGSAALSDSEDRVYETARKYLDAAAGGEITEYNDSDDTEYFDLLSVIDTAIKKAKRRHV